MDGLSLLPVLRDRKATLQREALYWHLPHYHHSTPASAIRQGDWKLIEFFENSSLELYNLRDDLSEANNLAAKSPDRVKAMHAALKAQIPEIARIEVCYDPGRGEPSRRRKPEPGMLVDAAAMLDLDLSHSWMVGDRWRDIDCGKRAGVRTIFIDFGYAEVLRASPEFTVTSLHEAAGIILAHA